MLFMALLPPAALVLQWVRTRMDRRTFVTPLALAVAGVFPCLVLSPLAGMSLSVGINILLLLRVQELSIRRKLEVPPPSSTSLPDGVLKVFPKRILDAPLIPNYMNAADRDALSPLPSLAPLPPLPCAVPVAPALEDLERQQLATGAMVLRPAKQVSGRSGSAADARRQEGLAAQRIDVPARVVWETLLDFDAWPKMVDNVAAAKVYEHEGNDIKVHVTLSVGFMRISTYVHHVLDEEAGRIEVVPGHEHAQQSLGRDLADPTDQVLAEDAHGDAGLLKQSAE